MVENLPTGATNVRMADNITEYNQEDTNERKMYQFDEVTFELPVDNTITKKQIEDDFEKYWEYGMKNGQNPGSAGITQVEMMAEIQKLQEKNEMLESCLLEMSELVYA